MASAKPSSPNWTGEITWTRRPKARPGTFLYDGASEVLGTVHISGLKILVRWFGKTNADGRREFWSLRYDLEGIGSTSEHLWTEKETRARLKALVAHPDRIEALVKERRRLDALLAPLQKAGDDLAEQFFAYVSPEKK